MQEVLVDGRELVGQLRVEQPDDVGIALHGLPLRAVVVIAS
jgi:hypothetical protein